MFTMKMLIPILLISFLTGCATGGKETILPQDGPTMKEIYEGHFTGEPVVQQKDEKQEKAKTESINKGINIKRKRMQRRVDNEANVSDYTRTASNEIQQIFPRLKNKTLVMYIFPHLSRGDRHPVPGYSTAFSFYEKTEYALPGEDQEDY